MYQRSNRSDFRDLKVWGCEFFRTDKWIDGLVDGQTDNCDCGVALVTEKYYHQSYL